MIRRILISLLAVFHCACELPFETKPTDKDELFTVTHDYDGRRIVHATPIVISWSDITIENFKEFLIERTYINEDDPQWALVGRVADSLATSYTDTLWDDVTHQYRVRVVDKNNQYRHALTAPFVVPEVTSIIVPDDYNTSIQGVYDTKFIDPGDTLLVMPGEYQENLSFLNKNVYIKGVEGAEHTVLVALHVGFTELEGHLPIDKKYYSPSVVEISQGILNGFTITGGIAFYGGGVKVLGNAQITNCIITDNKLIEHPLIAQTYPMGYGGGVFARGTAHITDCMITKNQAYSGGGVYAKDTVRIEDCSISNNFDEVIPGAGGIILTERASIINSTIYRNNPSGVLIGGAAIIRNCKVTRNGNRHSAGGGITVNSDSEAQIFNCIIDKNYRDGVNGGSAAAVLVNSIVSGTKFGFAINGELQILNSIIWGNSGASNSTKFYATHATYSDIQELRFIHGTGSNIDSNPLFVDPDAGDFHLQPDSPCIDAGHPDDAYRDVDGSRNDMGIYGGTYGNAW